VTVPLMPPPWELIEARFPGWTVRPPRLPWGVWMADWRSEDRRSSHTVWERTAADLTKRLGEITQTSRLPGLVCAPRGPGPQNEPGRE
jgi:hypothetical protein